MVDLQLKCYRKIKYILKRVWYCVPKTITINTTLSHENHINHMVYILNRKTQIRPDFTLSYLLNFCIIKLLKPGQVTN